MLDYTENRMDDTNLNDESMSSQKKNVRKSLQVRQCNKYYSNSDGIEGRKINYPTINSNLTEARLRNCTTSDTYENSGNEDDKFWVQCNICEKVSIYVVYFYSISQRFKYSVAVTSHQH